MPIGKGTTLGRWIAENRNGRKQFSRRREQEHRHAIEAVGKELRSMMPFLDAKEAP